MINYLVNLKATSSLDTIGEAYKHDCVDCGVLGDIEDVEIELGVRDSRSTPPPRYEWVFDDETHTQDHTTMVRTEPKIGRNDLCPCGSGKKYKKCCGKKS